MNHTTMRCSINELNSTVSTSRLFLECLIPKEKSCYLRLISSLFFCVSGEALHQGSFQQLPPKNKNIVLFYFFHSPLFYSYTTWGLCRTLSPWIIMYFHQVEIYKFHSSLVVVFHLFGWFGCSRSNTSVLLSIWHTDKGLLCYYYIKHSNAATCVC